MILVDIKKGKTEVSGTLLSVSAEFAIAAKAVYKMLKDNMQEDADVFFGYRHQMRKNER